ncbi:unnamed protein product [Discosporangium mesarthrocarpum]
MAIILQCTRGLEYLHSRGLVVHRDIKSPNYMVTEDLHVKLGDLANSRPFSAVSVGAVEQDCHPVSLPWSAPELLEPNGLVDSMKADVYSLAMVMAEVTNGTIPFEQSNHPPIQRARLVQRIQRDRERPELARWTPMFLAELIRDLWEQDPFRRPSARRALETLEANLIL